MYTSDAYLLDAIGRNVRARAVKASKGESLDRQALEVILALSSSLIS